MCGPKPPGLIMASRVEPNPLGEAGGLWATKLAVACGNTESIAKLFSIQRRALPTSSCEMPGGGGGLAFVSFCFVFLGGGGAAGRGEPALLVLEANQEDTFGGFALF